MSRYSPMVLPQRGMTLAEGAVAGLEAFRATRDRTRRQGLEDAAERRAVNADTRAGNQDRRADAAEGRAATEFDWRGEDRAYENTTMRPMREAATRIGLMNEGMLAPGQAGGTEVAPGMRFDLGNTRLQRDIAAEKARQQQAVNEMELRRQEVGNRLTIAREGDATQIRVAEIAASRPPSGGFNFAFGAGGGTPAQRQAAGEFFMNKEVLEGMNRQEDDARTRFRDGMRDGFASPEDSARTANNLRRYSAQRDSIQTRQQQLLRQIRGEPAPMPPRNPRIAAQQARDGEYAAQVTAAREAAIERLNAIRDQKKAAGTWTAKDSISYQAQLRRARSGPAEQILARPR